AGEEFHATRKPSYPQWGEVPYQLGDWHGQDTKFDPIYGPDVSDTSLLRIYENSQRHVVIAYVGYYRELTKILEVHSPEVCYPAHEWTMSSTGKFNLGEGRGDMSVEYDVLTNPEKKAPRELNCAHIMSVDVEDYFMVEAFANSVPRETWESWPSRVVKNTMSVLDLFDKYNVKGTFFFVG